MTKKTKGKKVIFSCIKKVSSITVHHQGPKIKHALCHNLHKMQMCVRAHDN